MKEEDMILPDLSGINNSIKVTDNTEKKKIVNYEKEIIPIVSLLKKNQDGELDKKEEEKILKNFSSTEDKKNLLIDIKNRNKNKKPINLDELKRRITIKEKKSLTSIIQSLIKK